jgi:hypothetical protein
LSLRDDIEGFERYEGFEDSSGLARAGGEAVAYFAEGNEEFSDWGFLTVY